MNNDYVTDAVWNDILLKNIKGKLFCNVKTIPNIEGALEKKYQVFEILVAETLAKIRPEVSWEITYGSKDDGVDIKGIYSSTLKTPFSSESPQELILGQIKRRNKGYRFDHFRTDIDKMFEYYSSHCLQGNQSLFQLLFIISTDNASNITNLKNNLKEETEQKTHLRFVANISSSICLIDALDIIRYWKLNFNFIKNIICRIFTQDQINLFYNYLSDIDVQWISVKTEHNCSQFINTPFEYRISINSDIENVPFNITAEWIPPEENNIQLLYPLQMLTSYQKKGLQLKIINGHILSLFFRGLRDGVQNLGSIKLVSADGMLWTETNLGSIQIKNTLFPIYQIKPNKDITEALEKEVKNTNNECVAYAITGFGGIGKTSLISDIMVKAANKSYLCIDAQNPQGFQDDLYILFEILRGIFRNYVHGILSESSFFKYIQDFLGLNYKFEWENELQNFLGKQDFCINVIVECFVTILLKALQYQNILIWLSDMHWVSERTGELLRKIINTLKCNSEFLEHRIIFLIEGRKGEKLLYNHKYCFPFAWENFLIKADIIQKELSIWKLEDSQKLIISLLHSTQNEVDQTERQTKLANLLLKYTNGIPMHIIEQLKYLINKGKLVLKNDGSIFIIDPNCEELFSKDIIQLIRTRLLFFYDKYTDFVDYMILFANLTDYMTPLLSDYLMDVLQRDYIDYDAIITEMGIGIINGTSFHFFHEYYVNVLRSMRIKNQKILEDCIEWINKRENLDTKLSFCWLSLVFLREIIVYDDICLQISFLLNQIKTSKEKKLLYEYLCRIPDKILRKYNYSLYQIYFDIAQIIIQSGDWMQAKEYLKRIVYEINATDQEYFYYKALAYQDLSNISSGQLLLDESINYALEGLQCVKEALCKYTQNNDSLKRAEELLIERLAICQLFSGDLKAACITQENAYKKALFRNDSYTILRIAYEKGDILLHLDLLKGIKVLQEKYKESLNYNMLYEEEQALIYTMALVGKLIRFWKEANLSKIKEIYNECIALEYSIKDKSYNYGASINLQTAACAYLLFSNSPEQAISLFMKSLEKAVDANLNELLWKCYINIAQCYKYIGANEESILYSKKCMEIIDEMLQQNPINRKNLERLFQYPVKCLQKIAPECSIKLGYISDENYQNELEIHYVNWNECTFFIMN